MPEASRETLRVAVSLIDQVMNVVGELVLTRNQAVQLTVGHQDRDLLGAVQRLDFITSEIQERVMKIRMQPIANLWRRFPRICRDVAAQCGKQVALALSVDWSTSAEKSASLST